MIPVIIKRHEDVVYDVAKGTICINVRGKEVFFNTYAISMLRNFDHHTGVKSEDGQYCLVVSKYDISMIRSKSMIIWDAEKENQIETNSKKYFASVEFREKLSIMSTAGYIMHNGPFKMNGRDATRGKSTSNSTNVDPHLIWPKAGETWNVSVIDCNNVLIKRPDRSGFYEYYGDVFITFKGPLSEDKKTYGWVVEMDPYIIEEAGIVTDPRDLSNVEFSQLKAMIKNISNQYGIKYQRLCKMLYYYITNAPSGVITRCGDIMDLNFDDVELVGNWFGNLKTHIKIFNLDEEKSRKVYETIVFTALVFAHKGKKIRGIGPTYGWVLKGMLFEVIDIFDRADI